LSLKKDHEEKKEELMKTKQGGAEGGGEKEGNRKPRWRTREEYAFSY